MIEFIWHKPISTQSLKEIFQKHCGWCPPDSFVELLSTLNGCRALRMAVPGELIDSDFSDVLDFNKPLTASVWLGSWHREEYPDYIAFAIDSGGNTYNVMRDGSIWWHDADAFEGEDVMVKVADSLQALLDALVYYEESDAK